MLIDFRKIQSHLSIADAFELGSNPINYGDTFRRKSAVPVRPEVDLKQARFFERVSQSRGLTVKVFTAFEEAMHRLSTITQLTEGVIS